MIIPCIFGTTKGREVLPLVPTSGINDIKFDDAWIGVTTSQVKLRTDLDCFRVYRRTVGANTLTWIGLYRSVNEIGYKREGGFYGAGVWLVNGSINSALLISVLKNLADQVKNLAQDNGQFIKTISEIKNSLSLPEDTAALVKSEKKQSGGISSNANTTAFFTAIDDVAELIDWSQSSESAEFFGNVFIGDTNQFVPAHSEFGFSKLFRNLAHALNEIVSSLYSNFKSISAELALLKEQHSVFLTEKRKLEIEINTLKAELAKSKAERNIQTLVTDRGNDLYQKGGKETEKYDDEYVDFNRSNINFAILMLLPLIFVLGLIYWFKFGDLRSSVFLSSVITLVFIAIYFIIQKFIEALEEIKISIQPLIIFSMLALLLNISIPSIIFVSNIIAEKLSSKPPSIIQTERNNITNSRTTLDTSTIPIVEDEGNTSHVSTGAQKPPEENKQDVGGDQIAEFIGNNFLPNAGEMDSKHNISQPGSNVANDTKVSPSNRQQTNSTTSSDQDNDAIKQLIKYLNTKGKGPADRLPVRIMVKYLSETDQEEMKAELVVVGAQFSDLKVRIHCENDNFAKELGKPLPLKLSDYKINTSKESKSSNRGYQVLDGNCH